MGKIFKHGYAVSFIWAGFILAISFMEAWVKFRAESLEFEVGLDVGVHVFGALNMVERLFAALTLIYVFIYYTKKTVVITGLVVFTFLVAQSGYLLPELNEHAKLLMQGMTPEKSSAHMLYGMMDGLKVICLFILGFTQVQLLKK